MTKNLKTKSVKLDEAKLEQRMAASVVEEFLSKTRARPDAVAFRCVAGSSSSCRDVTFEEAWRATIALGKSVRDAAQQTKVNNAGLEQTKICTDEDEGSASNLKINKKPKVQGEGSATGVTGDAKNSQVVVAVAGVDGFALAIAQLAVLSAGAIFCPVDLCDPRRGEIVREAQASMLLVGCEAWQNNKFEGNFSVLEIANDVEGLLNSLVQKLSSFHKGQELPLLQERVSSELISHIFFTSGSTGKPKGVVVKHASLLAYAHSRATGSNIKYGSCVFIASSLTFDPSLGEMLAAVCNGATAGVASSQDILGGHLVTCLQKAKATHVCMTPTVLRMRGSQRPLPEDVPTLRELSLGGEPMPENLAQEARESWPGQCRLVNIYGVTEVTVYQCLTDVRAFNVPSAERLVVNPLAGILLGLTNFQDDDEKQLQSATCSTYGKIKVEWLDHTLLAPSPKRACPPPPCEHASTDASRVRELVLGGIQVAEGYLHRDELTAEKFVHDEERNVTCFRTGDLGALQWIPRESVDMSYASQFGEFPVCSCGDFVGPVIKLLGRRDHQIKIRGVRIETGEVERHLAKLQNLLFEDVAVVKHTVSGQLVAWVSLAEGVSFKELVLWDTPQVGTLPRCVEEAVRAYLKRSLPAIMIPSRFAAVQSFKTFQSANGKRDVQKLGLLPLPPLGILAPQRLRRGLHSEVVPNTHEQSSLKPLEQIIAKIWSTRLGIPLEVIGPWDSFVSIGGDSLEAQRVMHELVSLAGGREAQVRATEEAFGEFNGPFSIPKLLSAASLRDYAKDLGLSPEGQRLLQLAGKTLDVQLKTGKQVIMHTTPATDSSEPSHPEKEGIADDAVNALEASHTGAQHALFVAVADDMPDVTRVLISASFAGLDPDAGITREQRGKSPLHVAAAAGHPLVIQTLLDCGANVFATTNDKVQPAHIAASSQGPGGTSSFKLLLDALRERNVKRPSMVRDGRQQTLLHAAARGGNPASLTLALEELRKDFPEDEISRLKVVRCLDRWSRTALHWAVVNGHTSCVKILVDAGAEAEPKLREGVKGRRTHLQYESPLEIARRKNHHDILQIFGEESE